MHLVMMGGLFDFAVVFLIALYAVRIDRKLTTLLTTGASMNDELTALIAALNEANTLTNDIASDIEQLIASLGQAPSAADVKAARALATGLADRLRAVAAAYTPPPAE